MNVFCIGPEDVDRLWPVYGRHLERYEEEGHEFVGNIRRDLYTAQKQLWGLQKGSEVLGVVVTRINDTPKGLVCEVYAACGTSGGLKEAAELILPCIEEWALSKGCKSLRVSGRNGWKRLLNYKQTGVVLEKELGNGL